MIALEYVVHEKLKKTRESGFWQVVWRIVWLISNERQGATKPLISKRISRLLGIFGGMVGECFGGSLGGCGMSSSAEISDPQCTPGTSGTALGMSDSHLLERP